MSSGLSDLSVNFQFKKQKQNRLTIGFDFSSFAIDLRNGRERLEAIKFIRRFLSLYPLRFPQSFVYILVSIVSSSYLSTLTRSMNPSAILRSDQMVNCSLELLCEIGKYTLNEKNKTKDDHLFDFSDLQSTYFT